MIKAILQKLFGVKSAPSRPTRRELMDQLDAAAKAKGLPPPDREDLAIRRVTPKDLQAGIDAIRSAPAATIKAAAGTEPPQPSAAALNGEPRPTPATEAAVYRAAFAEARRDGGTNAQCRVDAENAVSEFRKASQKPTKPTQSVMSPRIPIRAADQGRSPTTTPTVPPPSRILTVEESQFLNWPKQAPEPTAPWGSVEWANQFWAYWDSLPPDAKHAASTVRPQFASEASLATKVLAWDDRRRTVVAGLRA